MIPPHLFYQIRPSLLSLVIVLDQNVTAVRVQTVLTLMWRISLPDVRLPIKQELTLCSTEGRVVMNANNVCLW